MLCVPRGNTTIGPPPPNKAAPCAAVARHGYPLGNMCRDDLLPNPAAVLMMGSDQYCLKWNNHWANLIRVFNSLLQSETFVDVTLACEGRHIKAHRLVLSACSPYFKELLVAHPDKHPIVILKDVRYSELRTLIEFIYNGEVSVEQHDLAALLCTARELQIKGLADNRLPGAPPTSPHPPSSRDLSGNTSHTFTTTTTTTAPSTSTATSSTTSQLDALKRSSGRGPLGSEDRPPPLLTILQPNSLPASASPHLPPYHHSRPASRETSPVHKRRRLSTGGSDGGPDPNEGPGDRLHPEEPNGLFPSPEHNHRQYTPVAGPSGLRIPDTTNKDERNGPDPHWDPDRPSPSISKTLGGPTTTATTTTSSSSSSSAADFKPPHSGDETDDDRGHMTIQSPEVILEEGEAGVGSSGPPSTAPSPTLSGSGIGSSTLAPPGLGGPLPPQMAILQQALANPGYHPLLHYFPPGLMDQQPPGMPPPKDLMHLLDVMKVIPHSARLPLTLGPPPGVGGLTLPPQDRSSTPSLGGGRDKNMSGGGGITCHICAMIMPSPHHLEEHIRIHEEEKPYKCDQCGQRYKYQSAFQRHQEQNHTAKLPGDKPFRCDVCGQCFKYHKSFSKHRSNHDILDRIMKSEADERGGHRCHPESYLQRLLINESSKSESEASVTVKEEGIDMTTDEGGDRPSTSNPTTFRSALLAARSENGIRKLEEGEEEEEEPLEEDEDDDNKGKFMYCVKCKLTFRDVSSFEGHCRGSSECSLDTLREVCLSDGPGPSRPPSITSSPHGSPRLSPSLALGPPRSPLPASAALAMPSPPTTSTLTGGLPPSSSLAVSTATASTTIYTPGTSTPPGQNPLFKLDPSGALMLAQPSLVPDPRQDEERPFKCPYCQKGFKGRENLKLHIRTHTGEKPYNCGVCGKAFGGRSDMNRHLRIHTGEKPYPCKVCGKKFARADYLSKHITTHLGIPFAKPVHSLQQSLQNLENMQNLQNLHKLQNMSNE